MEKTSDNELSAYRLRLGVVLLALFWIPFWLLEPFFAQILGIDSADGKAQLTAFIMGIQGVLGLLGLLIAGKQTLLLVRNSPYKKMPGKVWRVLVSGKI